MVEPLLKRPLQKLYVARKTSRSRSRRLRCHTSSLSTCRCCTSIRRIEAEFPWEVRLVVPFEQGYRLDDIRPLREALAPPAVILGGRVELWQIEGDYPRNRVVRHEVVSCGDCAAVGSAGGSGVGGARCSCGARSASTVRGRGLPPASRLTAVATKRRGLVARQDSELRSRRRRRRSLSSWRKERLRVSRSWAFSAWSR